MSDETLVVALHLVLRGLEVACALCLAGLAARYLADLLRKEH